MGWLHHLDALGGSNPVNHTSATADASGTDGVLTTPTTGLELHYRDWGGSGRAILLLHGLASSSRIWDLMAPRLRAYGRVVALDQRGHDGSAKPDEGYDSHTIVADARGAAQVLGLTTPVGVGHSWGASVALAYAAADPSCTGVVLVDGGVVDMQAQLNVTWEETAERLAPPDLSHLHLDDLVQHMGRGPLAGLDEAFRRAFFRSLMEEQPDGTIRPRLTRARHLLILRAMWEQRVAPLLAQVTCPILVILAEHEGVAEDDPYQAAKREALALFRAHPSTTVHILPNTIHDIPLQRPDTLADLIGQWLDQLPAQRDDAAVNS
jgi:pimeloyl-ACP methyl ester carboxylesterase